MITQSDIADCPVVESCVNYLGDMDELPVFYAEKYDQNNLNLIEHSIQVHDARLIRDQVSLDQFGFKLYDHVSAVSDFCDPEEVQQVYLPEIKTFIKALTGGGMVLVTGPVLRWSERSSQAGILINSRPGRFVHVDYSRQSFNEFARMHLENAGVEENEIDDRLKRRYVAYNIWRVMTPPPQDIPLCVCSATSTATEDVVTGEAVIDAEGQPELRFGSSLYRYNPDHVWFYFSNMTRDEALVFKAFDSDLDQIQGCPHSAFNDPTCPANAEPRASIEVRAYVYF